MPEEPEGTLRYPGWVLRKLERGRYRRTGRLSAHKRLSRSEGLRVLIPPLDRDHPLTYDDLQRERPDIQYLYYSSPIVTFHPDGSETISTCGWNTPTTRSHINAHASSFVPRVVQYRNRLGWWNEEERTPVRQIRCSECHGLWADKLRATIMGAPKCYYCASTGYVTVGGNPILIEWPGQGAPITFRPDGTLVKGEQ
jgi:hypothetical protein